MSLDAQNGIPIQCPTFRVRLPSTPGREEREGAGESDRCRPVHNRESQEEGSGQVQGQRGQDGRGRF